MTERRLFGHILEKQFGVSRQAIDEALAAQKNSNKRLGSLLLEKKVVTTETVARALAEQRGLDFLATVPTEAAGQFVEQIPMSYAREHRILPVAREGGRLRVVVADADHTPPLNDLAVLTKSAIEVCLATPEEILRAIHQAYENRAEEASRFVGDIGEEGELDLSKGLEPADLLDSADEAPVIRFVNSLITQGYKERASDIHIEPFETELIVRYRIDGILYEVLRPPFKAQASISSRIKIMAQLNIAEKRLPQDGRFRVRIAGKDVDVRVSTLPTAFGERVVLRLLDKASNVLTLEEVGISDRMLDQVNAMIHKSHGIFLVTGPTGSGKTTTLYAALTRLNSREKNIITVEDPIEYQLPGVGQIQVNPKIDLTFANGLRSILRQDPDIIMVGEIRDGETAEIAVQSALTGHMVFSTLHTNDAAGALVRLVEMGVEPFLAASSIVGILAQRLVRRICPHCRESFRPPTELLEEAGLGDAVPAGAEFFRGRGCEHCMNIGYSGRSGIYELLVVDETIRELLLQNRDSATIREAAVARGTQTLRQAGLAKALKGETTLEEVLRVTQEEV